MVTLRLDLYVPVNRIAGPPNFFSDTLRALHNGISDRNWDYSGEPNNGGDSGTFVSVDTLEFVELLNGEAVGNW